MNKTAQLDGPYQKIYREFSRQKYNQYKHDNPRMAESTIVSRIIQEWDRTSQPNRISIYQEYVRLGFLAEDKELPIKTDQMEKGKKTAAKSEPPTPLKQNLDPVSPPSQTIINPSSVIPRTHAISKPSKGNAQYTDFYKHYYHKLSKQHPKWRPEQYTSIIRLMWKKKNQKRGASKAIKTRLFKALSGRKFFRNRRQFNGEQAKVVWKRLPIEAKRMWETKAQQPAKEDIKKTQKVTKIKLGMPKTQNQSQIFLGFMNKSIEE